MAEVNLDLNAEDVEDVLKEIENSYGIEFVHNELAHVRTFGNLSDAIISKIGLTEKEDCTSQQAFYKLREAICEVKCIDKKEINVRTELASVFPKQTRRKDIKQVELFLEFKLHVLRPKYVYTHINLCILIFSCVTLFFNKQYGWAGIFFSIFSFWITNVIGKEFDLKTTGELAEKMKTRNYLKSRRDTKTVNKKELAEGIEKIFIEDLGLSFERIDREAILFK